MKMFRMIPTVLRIMMVIHSVEKITYQQLLIKRHLNHSPGKYYGQLHTDSIAYVVQHNIPYLVKGKVCQVWIFGRLAKHTNAKDAPGIESKLTADHRSVTT